MSRSASPGSRSWRGADGPGTGGAEEGRQVGHARAGPGARIRRHDRGAAHRAWAPGVEHRWDVFWDAPLEPSRGGAPVRRLLPAGPHARSGRTGPGWRSPSPVSRWASSPAACRFTVYRGTNLLRLEAVARTDEPSVAYIYQGGLKGFSPETLPDDPLARTRQASWQSAKAPRGEAGSGRTSCGHGTGWRSPGARAARSPSSRRRTSSSSPVNWR